MKTRFGMIALVLILGTVLLCSCSDDDVVVRPDNPIPLPGPPNEDAMMANFRTAYEDMNPEILQDMLHPDFVTILQVSTTEQFPDVGPTLDRDEEIRIAQRMFSGQPVTDPDGVLIPGISSIQFQIFEQQNTWFDTGPTGVIPNVRAALFNVMFYFDRPGASTLPVAGQIKFFASPQDTVIGGISKTYYTMIGQQDLTNSGKMGIEEAAWGSVKALYR